MNNQPIFLSLLAAIMTLLIVQTQPIAVAAGYIHFKPENGATIGTEKPTIINGTSAPSNTTRTNCIISMNVNSAGYLPVKPLGKHGPPGTDYTNWTTTTSPSLPGHNEFEAQLLCHNANGQGVSFIKHLVHNVTAVAVASTHITTASKSAVQPNQPTVPIVPKVGGG